MTAQKRLRDGYIDETFERTHTRAALIRRIVLAHAQRARLMRHIHKVCPMPRRADCTTRISFSIQPSRGELTAPKFD